MGAIEVPLGAYYGAQTQRAHRNFQISPLRFSRSFLRSLGIIKKSAAQVNMDLGLLPVELGEVVVQSAQGVAEGKFDDQFVVDVFQTGSGTFDHTWERQREVDRRARQRALHAGSPWRQTLCSSQ